jgi:uncharacterized protein YrrD
MTLDTQTVIRHSELLGRLVINRTTAEEVGRVEQLWLSPKHHQVVSLTCRSGLLGRNKCTFSWSQIETIGQDGLLVSLPEGLDMKTPEGAEVPINHELWSDSGTRSGTLKDYRIAAETGDVVDYLFVSNGWRGLTDGLYRFLPNQVVSMGKKRIIVQDSALQAAEQVIEGLGQKVAQVGDFLKEDYLRTKQDLTTALEGTQAIASTLQDKGQQLIQSSQKSSDSVPDEAVESSVDAGSSDHQEMSDGSDASVHEKE